MAHVVKNFFISLAVVLVSTAAHARDAFDDLPDPMRPVVGMESLTDKSAAPLSGSNQTVLTLQSTLIAQGRRLAVINGHVVAVGEWIDGARVVAIHPREVLLTRGDAVVTLTLVATKAVHTRNGDGASGARAH